MIGPGRFGGMLDQQTLKPRNISETLGRLGRYFGRFWYMIVLTVFFIAISTWSQVVNPQLTGQATDCFLVPAGVSSLGNFGAFGAQANSQAGKSASSCWLATQDPSTLSFSRKIIYKAYTLGGFETSDPLTATNDQRVAGLLRLILVMIALFVLGSILTG